MNFSKQQKDNALIVLASLLLITVIAFAYFSIYVPAKAAKQQSEQTLSSERQVLMALQNQLKELPEGERINPLDLQQKVAVEPLTDKVLLQIEQAELLSGTLVQSVGFTEGPLKLLAPVEGVENIQELVATVELEAYDYESITAFIDEIEAMKRIMVIEAINFSEFTNTGPNLCASSPDDGPLYTGQISGIGSIAMISSLFDLEGTAFLPITDFPYSVNSFFIFDESSNSLADVGGIIAEKFPGATGFLFYYGFESDSQPSNAVGFILEDGLGNSEIILREFEPTSTIGNMVKVTLNNNYYFSGTPGPDDQANLEEITNLLFEGGDMYASDFPVEGLNVFKLFNPCNQHEIFLVQ